MGTIVTGLSFLTLQRGNACRDAPRHKSAPRRRTQHRTRSVQSGMPTRSMGTIVTGLSFLTLRRGNACRDAPRHKSAPRRRPQKRTWSVQSGMPTRGMGTIVTGLSFLTLQRGNACRDAPRHKSAPRRLRNDSHQTFRHFPFAGCDAAQPGRGIQPPDALLPDAAHRQTAFHAKCPWRIRSCRRRAFEAPAPRARPHR